MASAGRPRLCCGNWPRAAPRSAKPNRAGRWCRAVSIDPLGRQRLADAIPANRDQISLTLSGLVMNSESSAADPLFVQGDSLGATLLDRVYIAQTHFFFPREVALFSGCRAWRAASNVLDVGTGNGYFISRLAHEFPDKRYTAIDRDPAQLSFAGASAFAPITFVRADPRDISQTFDAILLRFVAQHLREFREILTHLRRLLRPNGIIYITEVIHDASFFEPPQPEFRRLFGLIADHRAGVGADFDIVVRLGEVVRSSGLDIREMQRVVASSDEPGGISRLRDMEIAIIAYLKHTNVVTFDYDRVGLEMNAWARTPGAYGEKTIALAKIQSR